MRNFLVKLRQNHLLVLFTLGFLITLGAVLLEIDRNYYQTDKRDYINNNWNTIFPLDKEDLTLQSRLFFESKTTRDSLQYKQKLLEQRLGHYHAWNGNLVMFYWIFLIQLKLLKRRYVWLQE